MPAAAVTVVIPCYNGQAFIARTLQSVLDQQPDVPAQIIVVDDGSTDQSAEIVKQFARRPGSPVELVQQPNAGESVARNRAIEMASQPFTALLDADDLWMPQKIALQLATLSADPACVATHTRVFNFEEQIDDQQRRETEHTKDDPSVEDLLHYHYVAPSSLMVRTSLLGGHSEGDSPGVRFEPDIVRSEDMLFVADLRLRGRLRLVDQALVAKRVHWGQQTRDPWHALESLVSRVHWCRTRASQFDPKRCRQVEMQLGKQMVNLLEDRYWRRQFQGFENARQIVRQHFPQLLKQSKVANRRVWPSWVYRLRDRIGTRRG